MFKGGGKLNNDGMKRVISEDIATATVGTIEASMSDMMNSNNNNGIVINNKIEIRIIVKLHHYQLEVVMILQVKIVIIYFF